jgi:DnaK suppressor protein
VLKPEEVLRFKKRLEAERRSIESRIRARNENIGETVHGDSGVGNVDDEAVRIWDREDEIDSNDLDRANLDLVKKALDRIKAGTYGVSEVSGKPIPIDRLDAVPWASTLVNEDPLEPE